ncbi:MAG: LamG-like jellyroll fold domain-containing protein [Luteolibacter sp.]|uniref:LamG-like jellyroll fold domain-containing protein n=1 Tax=Luteolibacter sp. TaxID=1962973 RepID=UPI0032650462
MNWRIGLMAAGLLQMAGAAPAFTPYVADDATLHLWHLDERTPPFQDSGLSPAPLLGLLNGAASGIPSLDGFGSAVSFTYSATTEPGNAHPYGPILLAKPALDSGPADNVDVPFPVMGENGAFTMEAIVKLDMLPSASPSFAADIVTMDDDSQAHRVFLFRIEKPGFLSFVPISGDAVRGGGLATIPTTGPHAINTHDWFHVAVTYDGNENVADNLKLYWTRIGSGAEAANQIGRGTLPADLRRELGDFALGNSGKINALGPFEFFPGSIDEVRMSGVVRRPQDFFFVSPEAKKRADELLSEDHPGQPRADLALKQLFVDDVSIPLPVDRSPLALGPGTHRLDFDFGFPPGVVADPTAVKCRMDGLDEDWHATARGMTLTWEMLDKSGELIGRTIFSATRSSPGWESDVVDSPWVRRSEPLFIPENTRRIRVTMSSGTPDTTGCWVIDDIALTRSARPDANLWMNGGFDDGERTDQIGGIPSGWTRGGSEPAIARLMLGGAPALGLLDAEQNSSAFWTSTQNLSVRPAGGGETFLLSWSEAFNVISGSSLRATYMNVPSGEYTFRAIAVSDKPAVRTSALAFPLLIRQPVWKRAWFLPLVVAAGLILVGWTFFLNYQRRSRNRIAAIRMASAVERDRARIARDMHDDLGTRVSLLKHAASVVLGAIENEPGKARYQAVRLESAASDLVWAMDGLVWAVNPANDTLEHLAGHLSGVAQEIFRDAPVTLRISIPTDFPTFPLRSDFRHHFSLATKEALHNILKHAGPCEATLQLMIEEKNLVAIITDTGTGFDPADPDAGNGLTNFLARAAEMQGTCEIHSAPGKGTRVVLRCPMPKVPLVLPS